MPRDEQNERLLDEAARAGWLYYVGGHTQDEIARDLGVSRQRAQRLVSKAVADGLLRIRIEHPIAELMELGEALQKQYRLEFTRIAPDLGVDGNLPSVAPFAAELLETVLSRAKPHVIGFGTGRALRAMIGQMSPIRCPQHRLVSVIGNIAPDGTASVYDVLLRLSDYVDAPHYPLPTPVFAASREECARYRELQAVIRHHEVAEDMDTVFVGIGQMDESAPLIADGFLQRDEWEEFRARKAVGEICGRPFDADGNYIEMAFSERMTSLKIEASPERLVVGIASGSRKADAISGALKGGIINALITDEPSARALLSP